MFRTSTIALLIFLSGCSQKTDQKESPEPRLGVVEMQVTGSPEALPRFERGLLLLHSFEYKDAEEEFRAARKADPQMPMALWGIAMCQNFPIWLHENYDIGRAAIDSLDLINREVSEQEQDLIDAVKLIFAEDLEKQERDNNYRDAMARLHKKYPNHDEVAAFYALSILGTVKEARDYETYGKAAAVAKTVIDRSPKHPGALHYYIHACDDPIHAHKALDEAYAYAKTAPSAAHALHMPSHIFLPLGLWDDLIASNIDAWNASHERRERKNLENSALDFHSFHWLQYGYLQNGQVDTAAAMALRMAAYTDSLPAKRARKHLAYMQATYCAETDDFLGPIAEIDVDLTGIDIVTRAQRHWVQGMRAFRQNELSELQAARAVIEKDCRLESLFLDTADFKICIDLDREMPRQIDIDRSKIMALQLHAHEAILTGHLAEAEKRLREASDFECSLDLSYGPQIRKPSPELYADWLLEQGRTDEAIGYYEKSLERAPGRRLPTEALKSLGGSEPATPSAQL